jgi:hypothetical protein
MLGDKLQAFGERAEEFDLTEGREVCHGARTHVSTLTLTGDQRQ